MENRLVVCVSNDNKNVTIEETINAIKNAGFKHVFVQWYDKEFKTPQLEQVKLCKQLGLEIEFAHLGYQKINTIWTEEGEGLVKRFCDDIKDVHDLGINTVVMHLVSKWEAPKYNEIGLERIKRIVKYAEELGVTISFENTKLQGYVEYIANNIDSKNIGVCFDAGHYHCNQKETWDVLPLKGKINTVHLHDNNGLEDQHLLPLDGTMNWPKIFKMLKDVEYDGPITLEVCYMNKRYLDMDVNDFYKDAYKRGLALSNLI